MKKPEAKFCAIYQQYLMSDKHNLPAHAWEAKHSRGKDNIPFADIEPHQIASLLASNSDKGLCHKISDMSVEQKPYDGFFYRNSPAYMIMAYTGTFYIISIHNLVHEMSDSKRKSLTKDRAEQICIISVDYKMK